MNREQRARGSRINLAVLCGLRKQARRVDCHPSRAGPLLIAQRRHLERVQRSPCFRLLSGVGMLFSLSALCSLLAERESPSRWQKAQTIADEGATFSGGRTHSRERQTSVAINGIDQWPALRPPSSPCLQAVESGEA